jgi:choline dehydrogenase-like flavoprotein
LQTSANQRWVFDLVQADNGGDNGIRPADDFETAFFPFTTEDAMKYEYDLIIIGTGIGGGIVAGDLFDTNSMLGRNAKHVLVIERGGLTFHSHCLNAARPSGLGEDRGQQNDTFFAKFKVDYKTKDTDLKDLKAGPMFNLGGRSAAWGLFLPRIHDDTLRKYFEEKVRQDLTSAYFRMAEELMLLSLPTTTTVHQDLMERLNMMIEENVERIKSVQWQWGRMASEFSETNNFDFARGAYSTIDKLLEIAMSKPKDANGNETEHINFKQLLRTQVRSLEFDARKNVTGVRVRGPDGKENVIKVKSRNGVLGKVVVAAGSVESAAILLRSNVPLDRYGGLMLTDHDIFYKALPFKYKDPLDRKRIGPLKLQTYVAVEKGRRDAEQVLANMSIDASSFLPRGFAQLDDFPKYIISFIRLSELSDRNNVEMVNDEPVVTIKRSPYTSLTDSDQIMTALRTMTEESMKTMEQVLGIEFIPDPSQKPSSQFFKALELGGVAHELGTVPMIGPKNKSSDDYCLDADLKLRGYEGVYVCDLSIFPVSPEVNPTLTLAALALRLSRQILHPRDSIFGVDGTVIIQDIDTVYVVNHKGRTVKVYCTNRAAVSNSPSVDDNVVLGPGEFASWKRKAGTVESISVFELAYLSKNTFLNEPWLMTAEPGKLTPVT